MVVSAVGFRPSTRPSLTLPSPALSSPARRGPGAPHSPMCPPLPFSHSIFPRSNPLSSTSLSLPPRALGDSVNVITGFWIPEVSSPSLPPSLSPPLPSLFPPYARPFLPRARAPAAPCARSAAAPRPQQSCPPPNGCALPRGRTLPWRLVPGPAAPRPPTALPPTRPCPPPRPRALPWRRPRALPRGPAPPSGARASLVGPARLPGGPCTCSRRAPCIPARATIAFTMLKIWFN
jgi:hypothetical protein